MARLGTLRFRFDADFVTLDELAFSPDGKTLAAASHFGLWLFDAANGKHTKSFRPANTWFQHIAFSGDGKRLLTAAEIQMPGSRKGAVQIWDVAGGRKTSEVELENVRWLGWSAEGQPLAVCLRKGEINLHEIATGRKRCFTAKDLPDSLQANLRSGGALANFHCAVAKNVLAASDEKGVVHVWDTASGVERWSLKTGGVLTGGVFVNSLALSADGHWLASLSRNVANKESVQVWDLTTGKAIHTVAADQKFLHAVAFTPDGKTLATVGWQEVRFWDTVGGQERGRTKSEGRLFAASVSFTPDGKTMAAGEMYGGTLHLWDLATGERKSEPAGHSTNWPERAAFSSDGKRVATFGGLDGTIHVWDATTGRPLTRIRRSPRNVKACAFSPDGRTLVSCWFDTLLLCDAANGRELRAPDVYDPDQPNIPLRGEHLQLSEDGRIVMAFGGGKIAGWDAVTWKQRFRRPLAFQGQYWIASADADMLALPHAERSRESMTGITEGRGPMRVEELATGERSLTFPILKGATFPRAFSPDGRLLISITWDPTMGGSGQLLRVWEVLTARELLALPSDGNDQAAISPDGRLLAATTHRGNILLWDLRRGKELHRFKGFDARVTSLAFSPDGSRLVSGLSDSTLLVWDVAAVRSKERPAPLDAASVRGAWDDLAADARKAFAVRQTLASAPEQAMPLLHERLKPAQAPDRERIRKLLADLDSDQFAMREKARQGLAELGELAEPALRKALADKPSLEARRRIEALLANLRAPVTRPETLRALRAVAVLEDIGTPSAQRLLEELAKGTPQARQTREAKAARKRLQQRASAAK